MTDVLDPRAVSLPAPALRAFISHYAGVHAEGLLPGIHAGLPSRHAHLIISFDEPIELLRSPAGGQQQPGRFTALVGGLHDGPALVRQASRVHLVHVFFTPLGVRAILGVSNPELMSRVIELSDLWGTRGSQPGEDFLGIWRDWAVDVRGRGIDSGHFLAEEAPDETYAELRAFFAE